LTKDESVDPPVFRTEAGEKCEVISEKNYVFEITQEMREALKEWAIKERSVVPDTIRTKIL
jgi:hypothetical protein